MSPSAPKGRAAVRNVCDQYMESESLKQLLQNRSGSPAVTLHRVLGTGTEQEISHCCARALASAESQG